MVIENFESLSCGHLNHPEMSSYEEDIDRILNVESLWKLDVLKSDYRSDPVGNNRVSNVDESVKDLCWFRNRAGDSFAQVLGFDLSFLGNNPRDDPVYPVNGKSGCYSSTFEIKSGLIHVLPTYHGSNGEDPNNFLSEFHVVCSSMKPTTASDDVFNLRAFPFALKDAAKDWLYYLSPGCITTWTDMKRPFLEKYFPASKASTLKKEISNIEQWSDESFYEYWERFKRLCASCPYHGYSDDDLILYFYNGLLNDEVRMVNAASGGSFLRKTPTAARELLEELAEGSRQFSRRENPRKTSLEGSSSFTS
ncbi:uncharacterized protein LOC130798899 [Amaranthus tricolor]|uniref:uncharacterized protein LOC130798899 n=1 Tax=Amaranthus tricolor TaxID=29722 RepID=UPI002590A29A|nr:uncharacterized protein LOC130798899 [Amaranthus tricolor]